MVSVANQSLSNENIVSLPLVKAVKCVKYMELTFLYAFLLEFIKCAAVWKDQEELSNLYHLLDTDLEALLERAEVELRKQSLWYSGFEKLLQNHKVLELGGEWFKNPFVFPHTSSLLQIINLQ